MSGVALATLRTLTAAGWTCSVHRLNASLLGAPARLELHAIRLDDDPPATVVASVTVDEHDDPDLAAVALLAESCGMEID